MVEVPVVLDPGHGAPDPGAVGPSGLTEAEVTLDVAFKVRQYATRAGVPIVLTREADRSLTDSRREELLARSEVANRISATAFVSIHSNAGEPGAEGMEIYYRYNEPFSAVLAACLRREILIATNRLDRGLKTRLSSYATLENPRDYYGVLRAARVTAVIVEMAFISNKAEEALLKEQWFREKMAMGIAQGIRKYLSVV